MALCGYGVATQDAVRHVGPSLSLVPVQLPMRASTVKLCPGASSAVQSTASRMTRYSSYT